MSQVDKPVLVTVTTENQASADLIKKYILHAQTEAFEDVGHALFVDDASPLNATLEKFVSGQPAH
jgi:pimeloyl-ACP methyl ester carboxylesterase